MQLSSEIKELEKALDKSKHLYASYDYLKLSIASPKKIRSWADKYISNTLVLGEVINSYTFVFGEDTPIPGGLFCQKIFGPIRSWYCNCLKYYSPVELLSTSRKACDICQVEITSSQVRRYRMGYIELAYPIVHTWYLNGQPNYLSIVLKGLSPSLKSKDLHCIAYLRPVSPVCSFFFKFFKDEKNPDIFRTFEYTLKTRTAEVKEQLKDGQNRVRIGGELLRFALERMEENYDDQIDKDRRSFGFYSDRPLARDRNPRQKYSWELTRSSARYAHALKRIRIFESFKATNSKLSWMILTVLPVLPPALRPIISLENGQIATSDLNQFYREIILANESLKTFFFSFGDFSFLTSSAIANLQQAVDRLIDNAKTEAPKKQKINNKPLKSLTESLEAKEGRFRDGLLGKRIDYSARSVIVVGPGLQLNQCGLPYDIAAELFQPNLIKVIQVLIMTPKIRGIAFARLIIQQRRLFVWKLLEKIMRAKCILLNRAPTLHRFGVQAFMPVLVLGKAIQLHPSVCAGFNADFDGDQMAVHLPLSDITQLESRAMMLPMFNVLSPANGDVILKPTQDVVIGCHYLTVALSHIKSGDKRFFMSETDVLIALKLKKIDLHSTILVRHFLDSFEIKICRNNLVFSDINTSLSNEEIALYKIFQISASSTKCYLITNIGIFVVHKIEEKRYKILELFLETTAGRVVFNFQCKAALESASKSTNKKKYAH